MALSDCLYLMADAVDARAVELLDRIDARARDVPAKRSRPAVSEQKSAGAFRSARSWREKATRQKRRTLIECGASPLLGELPQVHGSEREGTIEHKLCDPFTRAVLRIRYWCTIQRGSKLSRFWRWPRTRRTSTKRP